MHSHDSSTQESTPNRRIRSRRMYRLRESRAALVLVVLIAAVAVVAFLVLRSDDNGSSEPKSTGGPESISQQGLVDLANSVDHPVYWAGARPNDKYELTIADTGNIFIRYLSPNTPVGSQSVASLTVGTYPTSNAYANLQKAADKPGAKSDQTPDGGLVVTNSNKPTSVYIAYQGSDHQVEIYDPDPKTALSLATSGAVVPIS
jgi:hypothetical protein